MKNNLEKFCILKRIIVSTNNYTAPCQPINTGSPFVEKSGYGHEEWNNTSTMKYAGKAYFNTAGDSLSYESEGKKDSPSFKKAQGNLCMVLFTYHEGNYCIVGVAAGVTANKRKEMTEIVNNLNIFEKGEELWKLDLVKTVFSSKKEFDEEWEYEYKWSPWVCPEQLLYWFPKAVPFNYKMFTDKKKLSLRFSNHQYASSDTVIELLKDVKLPRHNPIFTWLSEGDFE